MKIQAHKFVKSFSYTFFANLLSISVSLILILIVPKVMNLEDYGYWQLYIFYASYISYMSLGLTDGAYLRYGGYEYKELNKSVFISQYWFLVAFDIIVNLSIVYICYLFAISEEKLVVVIMTCISGVIVVPRSLLTFMLQATGKIKQFAIVTILERLIYFGITILLIIIGVREFEYLIYADILGKLCSAIYLFFVCKDLVFGRFASLKASLEEIIINIKVGSKLLIANLASLLVVGLVRFYIERNWNIETFGKVGLTLSISNMFMLFINSISVILFPALRRTAPNKLPNIYNSVRSLLMVCLLGMLVLYYPLSIIFNIWIPQYKDSFVYMGILFPIFVYESKMSLLINTYFKTLRKELELLVINLTTVIVGGILTAISVFVLDDLKLTLLVLVLLLGFRAVASEIYLMKILNLNITKDIVLEMIITIIFLVSSWVLQGFLGFIIYAFTYFTYLLIKKEVTKTIIINIKKMI
ncbi:lipopolysaccharide biosynthesis protein [Priestia flexa]|uniref:lipopolysaccharide biosynthesis protein n=1 Tax=Priestia flexa TaxID=86664 RepID=UPI0010FBEFDC|nr:hypothetical protein [Priestia flexa]QCS53921.1 hypothetical protein FED53_15640 [Priestia flexa]